MPGQALRFTSKVGLQMGSFHPSVDNCNHEFSWRNRGPWSLARLCILLLGILSLKLSSTGAVSAAIASRQASHGGVHVWTATKNHGFDVKPRPVGVLRQLLQVTNETDTDETRPLAVRGDRYDPTRAFRRYRGGYDIQNRHYQASVVFTGVPAFVVAVVWLLAGLLLLCLHRRVLRGGSIKGPPKWRFYYWGPLLFAGIATLLSVYVEVFPTAARSAGLVLIFIILENSRFHKKMDAVETTISNTGDRTTRDVFNVTSHVAVLGQVNTSALGLSLDQSWQNATRLTAINEEAVRLQEDVHDVVHVLHIVFKAMKISLYAGAATEVLLLFLGLGVALLLWRFQTMRHWLLWLTALCWILTTVVWLGSGLFIVADNVADDTCTAMSEYVQDPQSTTLDSILPCDRLQRRAVSALQQIRQGVDVVVSEINGRLSEVQNAIGENLPTVCSPFAASGNSSVITMTASCPPNTTQVGDLPAVLAPLTCPSTTLTLDCFSTRRAVTQQQYNESVVLAEGLQSLITDNVPIIQGLARCSFVLDAFSSILENQCKPAKSALRRIWILLLLLSCLAMLAIVSWITAVKRNKRQPPWGSVIATDSPEP